MAYDIESIAGMLIDPFVGSELTANKISAEWESSDPNISLLQRLNEVAREYALHIDPEVAWDENRKLKAVEGELRLRIRQKAK